MRERRSTIPYNEFYNRTRCNLEPPLYLTSQKSELFRLRYPRRGKAISNATWIGESTRIEREIEHFYRWVYDPKGYIDSLIHPVISQPEKPSYPLTKSSAKTFYHKMESSYTYHEFKDGLMIGYIRDLIKEEEVA